MKIDISTYLTWKNGGHPYSVHIDFGGRIVVLDHYHYQDEIEDCEDEFTPVHKVVYEDDFNNIYVGDNMLDNPNCYAKGDSRSTGNSILIECEIFDNKIEYIFISHCVKVFHVPADDRIMHYSSPIGNNGVSYPYAIGKKNTYFLLDDVYVPNEYINPNEDGYGQFYAIEDESIKMPMDWALIHQHNY